MPTDPFGRTFVSYRRTRAGEAAALREALSRRGVPSWLDTADLAYERTSDELRRVIADPTTSGAILWATPDVATSPTIREVEAPAIMRRKRDDPSFHLLLVAAGGLDYGDVADVYGEAIALDDVGNRNMIRVHDDPVSPAEASRVANAVLGQHLEAIVAASDANEPLTIAANTREPLAWHTGTALQIDWNPCFQGRHCAPDVWHSDLLPATRDVRAALQARRAGRQVSATGLLSIPAAIAFGVAFSATGGMRVGWDVVGRDERWSLENAPSNRDVRTDVTSRDLAGHDQLVLVSVTQDVRTDANRLLATLPPIRTVVSVTSSTDTVTAADAVTIAHAVRAAIIRARTEHGANGALHVLFAGPVGLAFLIGQSLNTFPRIQTYEHDAAGAVPYRAAATITD